VLVPDDIRSSEERGAAAERRGIDLPLFSRDAKLLERLLERFLPLQPVPPSWIESSRQGPSSVKRVKNAAGGKAAVRVEK